MLSLDLFASKFERELREGAVDDLEYRRIQLLNKDMDDLMKRYGQARTDKERADIKRRYEEIKAERASYFKVREQQQPQRPPAKGLLKGKDLVTPQQRVAGATPAKPGVGSAVRDVVGGVKRWLQGKDDIGPTYESVTEQDDINKFGPPQGDINVQQQTQPTTGSVSGEVILQTLANAWEQKYPYVDLPFNPVATVSRPKIYDILVTLKQMNDSKMRTLVNDVFKDRSSFLLWSSNLKRRPTPVEKPKTLPGQMKLFKETDGQKKNSKSQDQVDSPQNLAVQRYLQQVRRKHPAATSDVEAIAKDEIEKQARTDQTIKDLKAVNRRQDAALKKAQSLDRQQGDEINDIENQIDQLAQKVQIIKKGKPADGVDATAPAKGMRQSARPSVSTDKPATKQTVAPKPDQEITAPAAAVIPVTDKALSDKVQNLEKQVQQAQQQGDPENKVQSLLTQLDQAQKALNQQIAKLGAMQQKTDSSAQGLIDLFPQEKPASKTKSKSKTRTPKIDLTKQKEPEDLSLAKSLLSKYRTPEPVEVEEHGGGIGPRQRWQDLMPEGEMSKIDIMRQDLELMSDLQFLRAHGLSKVAFKQKYRTLLKPAPQQDMPTENWSMPGTTIPRKSVIQGYTVYWNPETKIISVTRSGDSEEAAIEQAKLGTPNLRSFKLTAERLIDRIEELAEGWSDKYGGVMRPPTPYSVYIKGKKWKDFTTDDHAQAVANKLKAKFKADGRDPETVTIAPTDMTEDFKKSAKAAALAACIVAGGTLSGCATNPSVQGTIGTVRDVGTAVKTAQGMTRAGVQDELNQELRNFIRAQGGDPGSQNLSLLYKLQKRLQGKKEPQQAVNEIKDTPAVERAIIERLMVTDRPFMIKFGPAKVMGAAENVAYNVGDVGAFGKEDVDSWVHQVKQILGATP